MHEIPELRNKKSRWVDDGEGRRRLTCSSSALRSSARTIASGSLKVGETVSTVRPTCVRVYTFQVIRPLQQPARLHRIRLWSDVTRYYRFISIVLGHLSRDFVSSRGYLTGCLGHYTVHLCTVIRFARILSFCLRRPAEREKNEKFQITESKLKEKSSSTSEFTTAGASNPFHNLLISVRNESPTTSV